MCVDTRMFEPSDWVPNNQRLPVLHYNVDIVHGESFETLFAKNGWTGIWIDSIFDYQHYHTGAHEVLGITSGSASLLIGGPTGHEYTVTQGDCLILPAGTGHQNLYSSEDFAVVGAYPSGQYADIQRSWATGEMLSTIAALPLPRTDPVQGPGGVLLREWR